MTSKNHFVLRIALPAAVLSLLLTIGFQCLIYVSAHGLLDDVEGAAGLLVGFPVLVVAATMVALIAAALACYIAGASVASKVLALAAGLTIAMSFLPWTPGIDRIRLSIDRGEIAEALEKARDAGALPPGEPVALWWGESGFAGMNVFSYLVHDPSGAIGTSEDPPGIYRLDRGWESGTRTHLAGLRCKSSTYRVASEYVIIRSTC